MLNLMAVFNNDTILYYDFSSVDADTIFDNSSNKINAFIYETNFKSGLFDNAAEFNDTSSYILVDDEDQLDAHKFTIMAWVNPYTYGSDWRRMEILEKTNSYWMNIGSGNNARQGKGILRCGIFGMTEEEGRTMWRYIDSDRPVPVGEWTHTAFTYDGDTLISYLNGVRVAEMAIGLPYVSHREGARLSVGVKYTPNIPPTIEAYFDGLIDEVIILDTVLNDAGIRNSIKQLHVDRTDFLLIGAESVSDSVQLVSNIDWKISTSCNWIQVNKKCGSGNATIKFTLTENTDNLTRVGYIEFKDKNTELTRKVRLEQNVDPIELTLSDSIGATGARFTGYELELDASHPWTAAPRSNWLTNLQTNGERGEQTLTITPDAYNGDSVRYDTIDFFVGDSLIESFTIAQFYPLEIQFLGRRPVFGPFPAEAKSSLIINCDWELLPNNMLTVDKTSGLANDTVEIELSTLDTNTSERSNYLNLKGMYGNSELKYLDEYALGFTQLPLDLQLMTMDTLKISHNAIIDTFSFIATYNWELSSNKEWLTTNIASQVVPQVYLDGVNPLYNVIATAEANTTKDKRYAALKITSHTLTDSIVIEQAAYDGTSMISLAKESIRIYPNPASEFITIETEQLTEGASYSIYNTQGINLLRGNINNPVHKINLQNILLNGIYIINIVDGDGKLVVSEMISIQ